VEALREVRHKQIIELMNKASERTQELLKEIGSALMLTEKLCRELVGEFANAGVMKVEFKTYSRKLKSGNKAYVYVHIMYLKDGKVKSAFIRTANLPMETILTLGVYLKCKEVVKLYESKYG